MKQLKVQQFGNYCATMLLLLLISFCSCESNDTSFGKEWTTNEYGKKSYSQSQFNYEAELRANDWKFYKEQKREILNDTMSWENKCERYYYTVMVSNKVDFNSALSYEEKAEHDKMYQLGYNSLDAKGLISHPELSNPVWRFKPNPRGINIYDPTTGKFTLKKTDAYGNLVPVEQPNISRKRNKKPSYKELEENIEELEDRVEELEDKSDN